MSLGTRDHLIYKNFTLWKRSYDADAQRQGG